MAVVEVNGLQAIAGILSTSFLNRRNEPYKSACLPAKARLGKLARRPQHAFEGWFGLRDTGFPILRGAEWGGDPG
ncbi:MULTISPECIES: hypothetical protein [Niastella]|uniref:Uncharacterized protein n=1 Tax=Niastella soli TaxID=2821487 RepID=A0ABS3YSV7_9BACT|nr:hypothetical protein [Niastella soli]MBO9200934.1 hypothetical protein [Niastella soli]